MLFLDTKRLRIRNWIDSDRDLFREINRDPKVMEFFPFRRSHEEADLLMERMRAFIDAKGFGLFAVELRETREPIGFCGLAPANLAPLFPEETIEIGWRLATRYWGNGYATEAASALLSFGFTDMKLEEIIAVAVRSNRRSLAVMQRIGMTCDPREDFDHPRVPGTHPKLKRHAVWRIARSDWREQRQTRD